MVDSDHTFVSFNSNDSLHALDLNVPQLGLGLPRVTLTLTNNCSQPCRSWFTPNKPTASHRWSLWSWQAWDTHVTLHASWSRLALFALFALLPPAALRSFASSLSWWA